MTAMSLLRTPPEQASVAPRDPASRSLLSAQSFVSRRGMFFAATAVLYASAILLTAATLHPYFGQTWDVATFIQAGRQFLAGGNPLGLYADSRAAQTWPYAYPPLHALAIAAALLIGDGLGILPDYIWARVPPLAADIAVALVLYAVVERKSSDPRLARAAYLLWLFNPVTFYDTAVQGHFESEWLLPVLLAYAWFEESRGLARPMLALAAAVLFKQVAILFALPLWLQVVRAKPLAGRTWFSFGLLALVVGAVCLPFWLYSGDFLYMNLTYVENVPVQTSSWIIALLGLTRTSPEALSSDSMLLRYQTLVTLVAAGAIAWVGARRGWSLWLTAALIALAFFLTSKKVMGYYYVMLLPFMLAEELPRRRFSPLLLALVATTWMALSPYYAAWVDYTHWWVYAALGLLNSLLLLALAVALFKHNAPGATNLPTLLFVSLGLFAGAAGAALLQPLVSSVTSPIRAPIIVPGTEARVALALVALGALLTLALVFLARRLRGPGESVGARAWGLVLLFAPLFFVVYTLTKESTALWEIALEALGG